MEQLEGQMTGGAVQQRERRYDRRLALILAVLMVGMVIFCVLTGRYSCTKLEVLMAFFHMVLDAGCWLLELPALLLPGVDYTIQNPMPVTWEENVDIVLQTVRIPRILAVILIGGGLSVSGASYQCLFRNPLVSESILGVSSGASFGASLAILLTLGSALLNVFAFAGGILAVALTYSFSKVLRGNQTLLLVLTGSVVSSIFSAGLSIVKYVAPTETALPEITFWLMGSFGKIARADLLLLAPVILICCGVLLANSGKMNVLTLGDAQAKALGVNVGRLRFCIVVCATLITAVSVCVCGMIGWVGVIIPQITRMIIGPDARRLMPCAFFIGALFMMLVDVICRALLTVEIPVGIVTSLAGAPVFLYILKRAKEGWT